MPKASIIRKKLSAKTKLYEKHEIASKEQTAPFPIGRCKQTQATQADMQPSILEDITPQRRLPFLRNSEIMKDRRKLSLVNALSVVMVMAIGITYLTMRDVKQRNYEVLVNCRRGIRYRGTKELSVVVKQAAARLKQSTATIAELTKLAEDFKEVVKSFKDGKG